MHIFAVIAGIAIAAGILLDAFETIVLPRRITRTFRLTSWFYRNTWVPWARGARRIKSPARREAVLGYFGPSSLILLLVLWAFGLIFGLAVLEAGMGFAFLGVVIGYLPTIYSAFSRREIEISLLDARAGSPPTAAELLTRFGNCPQQTVLDEILRDWERWAAEVLESHLSYPVLSFYRSQHSNQSWLGALTVVLDATALVIAGIDGISNEQARWTFKIARHAVVDLAQVVNAHYDPNAQERLNASDLGLIRARLAAKGLQLRDSADAEQKLAQLRMQYEPYVMAIAKNLYISLPPWIRQDNAKDNWQAGPWDRIIQAQGLGRIAGERRA